MYYPSLPPLPLAPYTEQTHEPMPARPPALPLHPASRSLDLSLSLEKPARALAICA
ncbi:hypothetical protein DPMN_119490 [Dreissena polymorpha]|uniref:Uncharacterized protein n=1 Tax=Dreissena polymorpha TaxID=45954 RepID=A0A9D4GM12_DREPO|nr:hypothetical protein DPMN_119490 [Dreissena polymorpha]